MTAAVCLMQAAMSFLIWCMNRTVWANLLFSAAAASTAVFAACEFWMMRSESPAQFGEALRWIHVPTWATILALVGFVRVFTCAPGDRGWLGASASCARLRCCSIS